MMLGILSSAMNRRTPAVDPGEPGSGEPPEGATAYLDFVNGFYYADGASRSLSALLGDGPDTVHSGGGFNPEAITGNGMLFSFKGALDVETTEAYTNRPYVIGPLYTALAAALADGGTIVFDLFYQNTPYGPVLAFYDSTSENAAFDWVTIYGDNTPSLTDGYDIGIGAALGTTGAHKLAVTLNRDVGGGSREYAFSLDGAPADTQTVTYSDPFPTTANLDAIMIGHDGDDSHVMDIAYIRSITLYPAKVPADLPALSSLLPSWLPSGATAFLDFVNGNYYAGGDERAIGTLLGGGFDAGQISGSGYHVGFDVPANNPNAAGSLLSDLSAQFLSGATLVFEIDTSTAFNGTLLFFMDAATVGSATEYFEISMSDNLGMNDQWDLAFSGGSTDALASGVQKIALTLNQDVGTAGYESACSINGGTVFSATVGYNYVTDKIVTIDTINLFHLSGSLEIEGNVRTVTLYPAKDSSELPALSA